MSADADDGSKQRAAILYDGGHLRVSGGDMHRENGFQVLQDLLQGFQ